MTIFGCDFLPNPGNVAPFVKWNKQKERARREIQVKCYERFNHRKTF